MPDESFKKTAAMSPSEYAAFTGAMSHPVGADKLAAEAQQQAAAEASDADCVRRFLLALADPEIRLVTEKPNDWTNWGAKSKAAILAALRRAQA